MDIQPMKFHVIVTPNGAVFTSKARPRDSPGAV